MNKADLFNAVKSKRIPVIGRPGSFEYQIVKDLFNNALKSIHFYSRDDKQRYAMALSYEGTYGKP